MICQFENLKMPRNKRGIFFENLLIDLSNQRSIYRQFSNPKRLKISTSRHQTISTSEIFQEIIIL